MALEPHALALAETLRLQDGLWDAHSVEGRRATSALNQLFLLVLWDIALAFEHPKLASVSRTAHGDPRNPVSAQLHPAFVEPLLVKLGQPQQGATDTMPGSASQVSAQQPTVVWGLALTTQIHQC